MSKSKTEFVVCLGKKVSCPSAVMFRSQIELGGYCDNEVSTKPSKTDRSQDEPIEKLVARVLAGQIKPVVSGGFDVPAGADVNDKFEHMSETEHRDFDLSDAARIAAAGAAAEAIVSKTAPKEPEKPAEAPKEAPKPPEAMPPAEAPKA